VKSRWIWVIFGVLVAAQLAVPAWHIVSFEQVLKTGTPYRFRCAPVDPFDAFRGRYVRVAPRIGPVPCRSDKALTRRQTVFVKLREGSDGFAEGVEAVLEPPAQGDYTAAYYTWSPSNGVINVDLPFDRFYMPERLAPQAERAYGGGASSTNAWLAVRLKNGRGVIENLYVDERPIAEVARAMAEKR
jgi:hypothetical protein